MVAYEAFRSEPGPVGVVPSEPGGLLDVLSVAAVVLDAEGRIALWSPQAHDLFGWSAKEALGRYAAKLLVAEEYVELVLDLFAKVMIGGGAWAGVFPVRHKDGSTKLVEFRNMRLLDEHGGVYALGIACDEAVLRGVERDLALSVRLVAQSPLGLAVLDTDLRYVLVNPALERIHGLPAEQHLGRTVREAVPFLDTDVLEASMRQVLETGAPLLDQFATGHSPADPDQEHAWSRSYYRLEDSRERVIGVAMSVVDVTDRHLAAAEAAQARRRLDLIARASVTVGTTLDLESTARELADLVVAELADVATVDVLESVLEGSAATPERGPAPEQALFRALAIAAAYETDVVRAADPVGERATYPVDRMVTRCVGTGRPVLVAHVTRPDLAYIARDEAAAKVLAEEGVHSYLAVPLIARGQVLGVLGLVRARNPLPFDHDDVTLAGELAVRAAIAIDNARWYQHAADTALTLQRHLLPHAPPRAAGLQIAYRYQPAAAASGIGGDWFDAIPQTKNRTALVVGDVMGHGVHAAATMGQLRTATRTLAGLGLDPARVLHHLDHITAELDQTIATCVYVTWDPHRSRCRVALAGHLPPVVIHSGQPPVLLDLPAGVPLGAGGLGGAEFETTVLDLSPGDRLVLYTDGLVETRDESLDDRLDLLLSLLSDPGLPPEATCDRLLTALRHPDAADDVALVLARVRHHPLADAADSPTGPPPDRGPAA
ncbi:SpoIIE family protein phosphatase [Streptomyces sp. ISL-66]|uniref:SpoIIE family protein phosphatase n=1 Tax=Streptomyces sp. ISL-66 TaxID=2819186 RepID=UPI001BE5A445|nr:SpoIIE family protein phosphatase [Streptomyces sp. ISL-66]MBT2468633.1 SpoIIE family protein phosphatase [Streptomyces sp. ISL-66]